MYTTSKHLRSRNMIETGGIAPDFTLTSHLGDEVQLSSYKSQKNIVLLKIFVNLAKIQEF